MKKKLSFILALIMLLSAFAFACNGDDSESSAENESNIDEESGSLRPTETGVSVNSNPYETIVSTGCSYVKSTEAGADYPDTYGTELTDGVFADVEAASYTDEAFSGYSVSGTRVLVDVDLGCEYDNIYKFQVSYLATNAAGINIPSSIVVYLSMDGEKWYKVGNMVKPAFVEGSIQVATLECEEYYKAHYVRFLVRSSSAWMFLDEVMAIADTEGANFDIVYIDSIKAAYEKYGAVTTLKGETDINYDLSKTLISEGKNYTCDGKQEDEAFKDTDNKLTDGLLSGFYEGETWVGFNASSDVKVTVDIGEDVNDISSLEASFYANNAIGLYMPPAVKFAAIDQDGNVTELGIVYGSTSVSKGNYTFVLPFEKGISARKIEFTFVSSESKMYLVEEVSVYAYRDSEKFNIYPDVVFDYNCTEWGNDSNSKYVNLISNKTCQIIATTTPALSGDHYNTPVSSTLLTDGFGFSNYDIHCGKYFKFYSGSSRVVIFDLEHISAVDKFTVEFLQRSEWAVSAPSTVNVLVSDDAVEWYKVGSIIPTGESDPGIYNGELKLKSKVKARYVVFTFATTGWVGCKELEVYGMKSVSGAVAPEKAGELTSMFLNKRQEPTDDILKGSTDLCLLYHGQKTEGYTTEQLIPYVAYVDKDGNIKDVMFDSFLFLLTGSLPSTYAGHNGCTASDCTFMINDVFKEGRNMNALEEAAGQVKKALGLPDDYKYKVTMSIYYPLFNITNFGDIDGDGVNEDLSDMATRLKVVKWYIEEFEAKFSENNYQNLEMVGYYWYNESIHSDDDSVTLLNGISDLCHSYDRDFFWIPYYTANGYSNWADYGFDVACMQPNYVFRLDEPYSKIELTAQYTALYGMGVEMEICSEVITNEQFFRRYMAYLAAGVEYGYMDDSIIMYYQGLLDFYNASVSSTRYGRTVYDYTYHFIKGDLKYKPDTITVQEFTCKSGEIFSGKIPLDTEAPTQFIVSVNADHGTVTMNNNGTFDYYPENGYTGDVHFSYQYNEYLGWSDFCNVIIHVE